MTTDVNGVWSQTGFVNGIFYSATPSKPGRIFVPPALTFLTSDEATALDFEATCPATPIAVGQTLSGTIAATDCRAADDPAVSADRYVFMGSALARGDLDELHRVRHVPRALRARRHAAGHQRRQRWIDELAHPGRVRFFELPQSGQYIIEATPLAPGLTGAYTVNLTASTGGFEGFGFVTSDGSTGVPGVTLTFSRVSGTGPLPGPTTTDADGDWSRAGFAFGTTYRVRASKAGLTFSPPFIDFAGDLGSLDFVTAGPGCVARAIQFNQTLTGALDVNDCRGVQGAPFFDLFTFTGTAARTRSWWTSPGVHAHPPALRARRSDRRRRHHLPDPVERGLPRAAAHGEACSLHSCGLRRPVLRHPDVGRAGAVQRGQDPLTPRPTSRPPSSGPRSATARPTAAASAPGPPAWPARRPSLSIR